MLITTKEGNNNKIFIISYCFYWEIIRNVRIFLNFTNDNDNKSWLLHAFSFFITNKKNKFLFNINPLKDIDTK